jgi:hypothetical protein
MNPKGWVELEIQVPYHEMWTSTGKRVRVGDVAVGAAIGVVGTVADNFAPLAAFGSVGYAAYKNYIKYAANDFELPHKNEGDFMHNAIHDAGPGMLLDDKPVPASFGKRKMYGRRPRVRRPFRKRYRGRSMYRPRRRYRRRRR